MMLIKILGVAFVSWLMEREWHRWKALQFPANKAANFQQKQIEHRRSEREQGGSGNYELVEDAQIIEEPPKVLQIPRNIPIDVREVGGYYQVIIDSKYLKIPE